MIAIQCWAFVRNKTLYTMYIQYVIGNRIVLCTLQFVALSSFRLLYFYMMITFASIPYILDN